MLRRCELLSIAHVTMHKHPETPTLLRTVVQTVRNISKVLSSEFSSQARNNNKTALMELNASFCTPSEEIAFVLQGEIANVKCWALE